VKYAKAAYRLEVKRVKEPDYPYDGVQLDQPVRVVEFVKSLQDADIEKMIILYLNSKNKLICIQVFAGTIDRSVIYPREIIKHAILSNAANVIIVHNHPSGDPTPSPEDKALTRGLVETLKVVDMRTLDHIILGTEGRYYSFTEHREII
jgi:DNA repair protein RadC